MQTKNFKIYSRHPYYLRAFAISIIPIFSHRSYFLFRPWPLAISSPSAPHLTPDFSPSLAHYPLFQSHTFSHAKPVSSHLPDHFLWPIFSHSNSPIICFANRKTDLSPKECNLSVQNNNFSPITEILILSQKLQNFQQNCFIL